MTNLAQALFLEPSRIHVWIARRTDSQRGCGSHGDPYSANTAAAFDEIMRNLVGPYTTVHIGPGDFHTMGYCDENPTAGWQLKPGVKLIGSGIGVTNLYLDLPVSPPNPSYFFAIGHALTLSQTVANPVDFAEISDLTIRCPTPVANTACGGIRLMGNHSRVRGVEVMGWGSQTASRRGFGIACATAFVALQPTGVVDINVQITNTGVEGCMVRNPAVPGQASVGIHVGPLSANDSAVSNGLRTEAAGLGAAIRNCFIDCLPSGQSTLSSQLTAISVGWSRGLVVDANQIHNVFVGGPYLARASLQDLVISNNYYRNVRKGPFFNLGTVSASGGIGTLTSALVGGVPIATVTLPTSPVGQLHLLKVGDQVSITGASPAGYNGTFQVTAVASSSMFSCRLNTVGLPSTATTPGSFSKFFAATRVVIENNVIELATDGTDVDTIGCHFFDQGSQPASDIFPHTNVLIRNNKFRYKDGASPTGLLGRAMDVSGARNVIVRDNIVESQYTDPMRNQRCGAVTYSNNRTPTAALIRGLNLDNGLRYDDIETEVEDALIWSILKKRR